MQQGIRQLKKTDRHTKERYSYFYQFYDRSHFLSHEMLNICRNLIILITNIEIAKR